MKCSKTMAAMSFALLMVSWASQILPSSAATNVTKTITTSGSMVGTIVHPNPIGKLLIAFGGLSTSQVEQIIKFDLTIFGPESSAIVPLVKQRKSMPILVYVNFIASENSHPDSWYIHDSNGNKITHKYWGWYLMDIRSTEWREYIANLCSGYISQGFNGVFADDIWTNLYVNDFTGIPEGGDAYWNTGTPYTTWQTAMREFLTYVRSQITANPLIYNGISNIYIDICDGKLSENFVFNTIPGYYEEGDYISDLNQVSEMGKYFFASPYGIPSDTYGNMLFGLACFLIGRNGPNAFFSWKNIYSEPSRGYYPEMDLVGSLGLPTGTQYSYQSVLARDFEGGIVLANPSGNTYTVNLQQTYQTLDGNAVTQITMGSHSGAILKKP